MNIVVIIADTLRTRHLGCYGNAKIRTPNLDMFARHSARFTRAYPESLPTIPVRRALHTGRRAYPFRDWQDLKWGTVSIPGWQPLADDEDTLAENLASAGYQTGFVCTTQHCWNPGYNFQRGFWQWEFVRGYSGEDRWHSPFSVPPDRMTRYGDSNELLKHPHAGGGAPMVLANRGCDMQDEETATAKAFQWAAGFVEDNRDQPFYLLIDSFAPHEPWEAPESYYLMYGDPNYKGIKHLGTCYGPADDYSEEEIEYVKAQYSGLVSHVDHWFGEFMHRLESLGLADNTAVLFISDHGTNLCDNPRNVIGKPADAMYPGVMQLPFLVRMPGEVSAGNIRHELVCNLDLTATVYDLASITSEDGIHGQSVLPLVRKTAGWKPRNYVTCRYGNSLCYIDDNTWALGNIDGTMQEVFDIKSDPDCMRMLNKDAARQRWKGAWERLLLDAGGCFPDYRTKRITDALGRGITQKKSNQPNTGANK